MKPRLVYISNYLLEDLLGVKVELTEDLDHFETFQGCKINYSKNPDLPGLHISPNGLLDQKGVNEIKVSYEFKDNLDQLFITPDQGIGFDLFSAAFYLISRYEEYLPHEVDEHGRFLPEQSIAFKHGFIQRAVVNRYATFLAQKLQSIYPSLEVTVPQYKVLSTVDIDSALAYKQKGLMRTLGGFLKDLTQMDFQNMKERMSHVLTQKKDPYDTYDELDALHEKHGVDAVFFFLLADYGHNDKGVSYQRQALQSLIKRLDDSYMTGIHPGYQSNFDFDKLSNEVERLEKITHRPVTRSRQHFLMLRFPETYQKLNSLGIQEDHSLGYAQMPGFRASIASPYPWYDLTLERPTTLKVVPFTVMDATLNMYQKISPSEAVSQVKGLIEECKEVGGQFITLWHNESLSEKWKWEGWSNVLDEILEEAQL